MVTVFNEAIIVAFIKDKDMVLADLRAIIGKKYIEYEIRKSDWLLYKMKMEMLKERPLNYWVEKYKHVIGGDNYGGLEL